MAGAILILTEKEVKAMLVLFQSVDRDLERLTYSGYEVAAVRRVKQKIVTRWQMGGGR